MCTQCRHVRTLAYNFSRPLQVLTWRKPIGQPSALFVKGAATWHAKNPTCTCKCLCLWGLSHHMHDHAEVKFKPLATHFQGIAIADKQNTINIPVCIWPSHNESQSLKRAVQASGSAKWRTLWSATALLSPLLTQTGRAHPMGSNQNQSDRPVIPTQACNSIAVATASH